MGPMLTAIEMTGTVDRQSQLRLDRPLPFSGPTRVKVIVLYPFAEEIGEPEWLRMSAQNPAFAYLHEAAEDIYSTDDGVPFHDYQA
jgi:hypothetical protein